MPIDDSILFHDSLIINVSKLKSACLVGQQFVFSNSLPLCGIDFREKGISLIKGMLDVGEVQSVGYWHKDPVNFASADNEYFVLFLAH